MTDLISRVRSAEKLTSGLFWDAVEALGVEADDRLRQLIVVQAWESAAMLLLERVGKRWFCISGPHTPGGNRWHGGPERYDAIFMHGEEAIAATPPLALVLAILIAKGREADG